MVSATFRKYTNVRFIIVFSVKRRKYTKTYRSSIGKGFTLS